ncbi:hypothetical protein HOI83_00515 [Candidatus Uhrbacteria bacterium]|jgi:hypothetical protein|nr:hypothetical protein [Candidatus Uhrbacteria bacterium]
MRFITEERAQFPPHSHTLDGPIEFEITFHDDREPMRVYAMRIGDNEFRWQDKDDEDTLFTSDEVKGWVQIERPIDPAADAERARHERSDAAYYQGLRDKDSGGSGLQIY